MIKWVAASAVGLFAVGAAGVSASATVCSTVAACVLGANLGPGIAVEGQGTASIGVFGVSAMSHGVDGRSNTSFGTVGVTYQQATGVNNARAGVYGLDGSSNNNTVNTGVAGVSPYGYGVIGEGGNYGGYFAGGHGLYASAIDADPLQLSQQGYRTNFPGAINSYGEYDDGGSLPFPPDILFQGIGCFVTPDNQYPECGPAVTINADGTASFGTITSNGSPLVRTKTTSGSDVTTYSSRTTAPTLEDLGKGTLRSGAAYVALEPIFASTIDASAGYMVFITPEGNSHGLYTSQLTSRGFAVRENDGGRSSLTFDYRIVARPSDTRKARLAAMALKPQFYSLNAKRVPFHSKPALRLIMREPNAMR